MPKLGQQGATGPTGLTGSTGPYGGDGAWPYEEMQSGITTISIPTSATFRSGPFRVDFDNAFVSVPSIQLTVASIPSGATYLMAKYTGVDVDTAGFSLYVYHSAGADPLNTTGSAISLKVSWVASYAP